MFEFKEGKNCNHRNTCLYFEDCNLSLTPKSDKLAISGWAFGRNSYEMSRTRQPLLETRSDFQ